MIPKSKRLSLAKDMSKIEPSILVEEIQGSLISQFSDNNLGEFIAALCMNDQPLLNIAVSCSSGLLAIVFSFTANLPVNQLRLSIDG